MRLTAFLITLVLTGSAGVCLAQRTAADVRRENLALLNNARNKLAAANLANDPAHANVITDMKAKLAAKLELMK